MNLPTDSVSNDSDGSSDALSNLENVIGSGTDTITRSGSDNVIAGGASSDTIDGGSGTDTLYYRAVASAVTVSLAGGTATGEGSDTICNLDALDVR